MESLFTAVAEALMGKSNKHKRDKEDDGWGNRGTIPVNTGYREYEYEDKDTKQKKRFRLKTTNPIVVNKLGDSVFGGRYYTLSEDPEYMNSRQT